MADLVLTVGPCLMSNLVSVPETMSCESLEESLNDL